MARPWTCIVEADHSYIFPDGVDDVGPPVRIIRLYGIFRAPTKDMC